tara:strand:- start:486 stop:1946 length:1461 start_codon:yes stop_codon:yes gene_type:complete
MAVSINGAHMKSCYILLLLLACQSSVSGAAEGAPPVLNGITVDKVSVDVSAGPQVITFAIDASDESGINWSAGVRTAITFKDEGGNYHYANGDNADPGKLSITIDSSDPRGSWEIRWLSLTDNLGNKATIYSRDLASYGLPPFIYVLTDGESTSNISLSSSSEVTEVVAGSQFSYPLNVENLVSVDTGELTFELSSKNLAVKSVSLASGASACIITTSNYNSTVSCSMSGVSAMTSNSINIEFEPGVPEIGQFNASIVSGSPDISYLNNYFSADLEILFDDDGDGVPDISDNCVEIANSNQLDTDTDGTGDACDTDDDNDGVEDGNDAFPIISLNGLVDTDGDGIPDDCAELSPSPCDDTLMGSDDDDDDDGVPDAEDVFSTDPLESADGDDDGVGDNADQCASTPTGETSAVNALGCGPSERDTDADGVNDDLDALPNDPNETLDSDGDGYGDNEELAEGTDPNDYKDQPIKAGLPLWLLLKVIK